MSHGVEDGLIIIGVDVVASNIVHSCVAEQYLIDTQYCSPWHLLLHSSIVRLLTIVGFDVDVYPKIFLAFVITSFRQVSPTSTSISFCKLLAYCNRICLKLCVFFIKKSIWKLIFTSELENTLTCSSRYLSFG